MLVLLFSFAVVYERVLSPCNFITSDFPCLLKRNPVAVRGMYAILNSFGRGALAYAASEPRWMDPVQT